MNFFKSQDTARKNTTKLIVLFLLAVLSLIVMTNLLFLAAFGFANPDTLSASNFSEMIDWNIFIMVGVGVTSLIVLGSTYKIIALSGGGARIAELIGATPVMTNSDDPNEQKILNVVEEMAIASGTPVPPVYLIHENSINAFAAGYTTSNAIIGITRGAIETLSRDQLQGVIAHEFSHILNGDMRLNIRLIGMLHGILLIGLIGHTILRGSARSRSSKGNGGALFLGLGLMIIGYAGTFFGNLIKAAVSRQREFLADASAVQFTRNPDGIAGALKHIGGHSGSVLHNPMSEEINHALFCEGIRSHFSNIYATHPPLDDRIRRIEPNWDGKYYFPEPVIKQPASDSKKDDKSTRTAAAMATMATVIGGDAIIEQIGQPTSEHLGYAHQLIKDIPDILREAAREPFAARALIYFLVLDSDKEMRDKQLHHLLTAAVPGVYKETKKLVHKSPPVKIEHRLPLIDMACSTLRQLSKKQYLLFRENLETLIKLDSKINLFEWTLQKIVTNHLDSVFMDNVLKKPDRLSLNQVKNECAILLSLFIHSGRNSGLNKQEVFDTANAILGDLKIQLVASQFLKLTQLNDALDQLVHLKPLEKPLLLKACASCITADDIISTTETELFRAISDTLGCPVPPLLDTQ